jgi:amino acid adenylation domain-containing protein
VQLAKELISEPKPPQLPVGEAGNSGSEISVAPKLYRREGETLDRHPVFLSFPIVSGQKNGVLQYVFVFSVNPFWKGWLQLPENGVCFRMATRQEAKAKLRDALRAEREAFQETPNCSRWLGMVSSDGSFRLLVTSSKRKLAECQARAESCRDACVEGHGSRRLLQAFVESFQHLLSSRFAPAEAEPISNVMTVRSSLQPNFSSNGSSEAGRISVSRKISAAESAQLRNFAEKNGLNVGSLFAAAWAHLLSVFSGTESVPLWRVCTQSQSGLTSRSLCAAALPAGGTERVAEWLQAICQTLNAPPAADSQVRAEESLESVFLFTQSGDSETLQKLLLESDTRLVLHVRNDALLSFSLSYGRGQFVESFAPMLLACLETLVAQLPYSSLKAVAELDLIPGALKSQYVAEPEVTVPNLSARGQLVHELIEEQVRRSPNELAGIGSGETITYAALDQCANQLAQRLLRMGAKADQVIAVHLGRSVDLLVAIVAILKSGAAYLPLDASLPPGRVETVLRESEAPIFITCGALASRFSSLPCHVLCVDAEREALARESTAPVAASVQPENLVYVTYTSGSTGKPKGVMVEHRNLVASFAGMEQMFGSERGIWLAAANISFDISLTELVWTLTKGSTIVFHEGDEGKPIISGSRSIPEQFVEHRITHFQATPALVQMILSHPSAETALKGLRKISVGGEAFPPTLASALLKKMSGEVMNAYGPTETTVCCTFHPVRRVSGVIPIGRSMVSARLYVLDKWGRFVPPMAPGELYIGGPIVTRGYHRRPDLTAERFLRNPFLPRASERMYRTGDIVRRNPEGEIEFLARRDTQVKVHGYRIELGEIEAVLNSHPSVRQSAVALQTAGNGQRLVGYFQVAPGAAPEPTELQEHLRKMLPEYMVPAVLLSVEQFPLTGSGKVDRSRLSALDAPMPGTGDDDARLAAAELPQNSALRKIEADLCAWCQELLGLPSISPLDDFFAVGGHSLVAAELVHRVAKKYEVHLRLSGFVKARRFRAIAKMIDDERAGNCVNSSRYSPLVTIRATGSKPPVFLLAGIGGSIINFELLARSLDPDRPVYAIETHGLDRDNGVLTTIEGMARMYLQEIRKIQPAGPYHLVGYSFGGVVAYEMAHQLNASFQEAGIIGLIDTSEYRYQQEVIAGLRLTERWHSVYRSRFRRLLFGPRRFDAFSERMRIKLVKFLFGLSGKLGRPLPQSIGKSEDRNFYALNQYTPKPYSQPIHLFRCLETDRFDGPDPLLGWGSLAKNIVVHGVPGQHGEVVREPYVHTLGAAVENCLQTVEIAVPARLIPGRADSPLPNSPLPASA